MSDDPSKFTEAPGKAAKVFISYAREDVKTARKLYHDLRRAGVIPWLDEQDLLPGQNWKAEIRKAIQECHFFLALLSSESLSKKGYVQKELKMALSLLDEFPHGDIFVIPVRADDCKPADERLKNLHWADIFPSYEAGLEKILRVLGAKTREIRSPEAGTKHPHHVTEHLENQMITNSIGMRFVHIPPGTFMMGSPGNEAGRYKNEVLHRVTLTREIYMQTTPVTQGQWVAVTRANPSFFRDNGDDCPVESVSWEDVQDFVEKLNALEETNRYRLPTEAEWEYACRARSTTRFCFGYDGNQLSEYAWYDRNSGGNPHAVGQKKPNAWGLYDMHGNVWEWCLDWYGDYPCGSVTDPSGPLKGSRRTSRGGSYFNAAQLCRSAIRNVGNPGNRYVSFGFRLVREAF